MKNVTMKMEGTKLIIECDLTKEFGPSSSGKTIIVASTEGNAMIDGTDGYKLGLNVYRRPDVQPVKPQGKPAQTKPAAKK